MEWTFWLSAFGLAIGAGMGLYSMINPKWGAKLVRLQADPGRPGGFAEFRGTYGGLFFFTHAVALALLAHAHFAPADGQLVPLGSVFTPGVLLVCATIWWGTCVGRVLSLVLDRAGPAFNVASVGFEIALGALIAAPLLATSFGVNVA